MRFTKEMARQVVALINALDQGEDLKQFSDVKIKLALSVQKDLLAGYKGARGQFARETRERVKWRINTLTKEVERRESACQHLSSLYSWKVDGKELLGCCNCGTVLQGATE